MLRSLYIAATGMDAQQTKMDCIANNLANASTTGFKRERPEFEDLFSDTLNSPEGPQADGQGAPTGLQVGMGVRTGSTTFSLAQGALTQTSNPFDLAIQGNGYFRVQQPDGTIAYTRAGNLTINATGHLCNQQGQLLEPNITVPPTATLVTIQANGQVQAQVPGQVQPQTLGTLELAMFTNPGGLSNIGSNNFAQTPSSGQPVVTQPGEQGSGTLIQGSLENSNVQAVQEMVDMITAQRAYELSSKVIQTADQMLQKLTSLR